MPAASCRPSVATEPSKSEPMSLSRVLIPLAILAWPLLEIAGFVLVGRQVGVLATVGLVVLSGLVGAILLRVQGFGTLARIRAELAAGRDPGREIAHGVMILVAGILLLLPGFVTDVLGLLLFVPPIRDLGWRLLKSRMSVTAGAAGFTAAWPPRQPRAPVIDLESGDYSRTPDPDSPWRRVDRD